MFFYIGPSVKKTAAMRPEAAAMSRIVPMTCAKALIHPIMTVLLRFVVVDGAKIQNSGETKKHFFQTEPERTRSTRNSRNLWLIM